MRNSRIIKDKGLIKQQLLPLGLEFEEVQPVAFDPIQQGHLIVVSDRQDGLDRMKQSLAKNVSLLSDDYQTMLIDTADQQLSGIGKALNSYISEQEGIVAVKSDVIAEINMRIQQQNSERKWLILLSDVKDFCDRSQLDVDEMTIMLEQGKKAGIYFILIGDYNYMGLSFEQVPKYIRTQSDCWIIEYATWGSGYI